MLYLTNRKGAGHDNSIRIVLTSVKISFIHDSITTKIVSRHLFENPEPETQRQGKRPFKEVIIAL